MCHYHEARDWAALREDLEEAEPDGVEGEAPEVEPDPEAGTPAERPVPVQPTD